MNKVIVIGGSGSGKSTFARKLRDVTGLLSSILSIFAHFGANILTIHQTIPIGGVADVTLSIEVLDESWTIDDIVEGLTQVKGTGSIRILARE